MASERNTRAIENTPTIETLLSRMPPDVASTFSEEQLSCLYIAIGARDWGRHSVDIRGTFKIPFYRWRYYYVMLIGRNRRELSRNERSFSAFSSAIFVVLFLFFSILSGLLALYLIKSALGIDLLKSFSFGIWGWFNKN